MSLPSQTPDPTRRFSDRVENYVRYRPGYPPGVVACLAGEIGLARHWSIADVGSGTGLLAKAFLESGYDVIGVEPNDEMRAAAERDLAQFDRFSSLDGRAEATGLPGRSVDLVMAGQAFHWFAPEPTRQEFLRVLKPGGWVALIWNNRTSRGERSPFADAYEELLERFCPEYGRVGRKHIDEERLARFFAPRDYGTRTFPNSQDFDFEGLRGRLLSSSYSPDAGHPNHEPMLRELRRLFDAHQRGGRVEFRYETEVNYGRLE